MQFISLFCAIVTFSIVTMASGIINPLIAANGSEVGIYLAPSNPAQRGSPRMAVPIPPGMTTPQRDLLEYAKKVALEDGYQHPQYLQGIIMQESRAGGIQKFRVAGLTNKPGDRYFGIGQIKVAAAKAVLNSYPKLWEGFDTRTDEELQARLILDDKFNVRIASKYLLLMGVNSNPTHAITAYNQGPGGAMAVADKSSFGYTVGVKAHAAQVTKKMAPKVVERPIRVAMAR